VQPAQSAATVATAWLIKVQMGRHSYEMGVKAFKNVVHISNVVNSLDCYYVEAVVPVNNNEIVLSSSMLHSLLFWMLSDTCFQAYKNLNMGIHGWGWLFRPAKLQVVPKLGLEMNSAHTLKAFSNLWRMSFMVGSMWMPLLVFCYETNLWL